MLDAVLQALFPARCLLCKTLTQRSLEICTACESALRPNTNACRRCALPLKNRSVHTCGPCLVHPPPQLSALASFTYDPPLTQLIAGLKHGAGVPQARILGHFLARAIRESGCALPDIIVPIPITYRRRLARGFNQSSLLALELSRSLDVPVRLDILRRVRHSIPQQGQNARNRLRNVRAAFKAKDTATSTIALVDDVITTGATVGAAAAALREAGAGSIHVWAIARALLIS